MLKKEGLVINTTNVMSDIQHSIRERQAYTEEVRVMTTENRLAVWIVSIIPFVLIAIMRNLMPGFRETLFENALGIAFSFLMFTTIIGGVAWALNIADVEKELL
jgi:Flp pilus assembly protein TadB